MVWNTLVKIERIEEPAGHKKNLLRQKFRKVVANVSLPLERFLVGSRNNNNNYVNEDDARRARPLGGTMSVRSVSPAWPRSSVQPCGREKCRKA